VLARLAATAGIPRIRIHELRDTYVSLMARSGVKIEVISELVGHSDPAFTTKRYRQVLPDEATASVLSLSEMIRRCRTDDGGTRRQKDTDTLPEESGLA